ncbi:serine/threonine-protein kinase ATR [Pelomyxa schiedti]|nr:serine/threonine-protein kinase ATR [Pelomyxa schiedti]
MLRLRLSLSLVLAVVVVLCSPKLAWGWDSNAGLTYGFPMTGATASSSVETCYNAIDGNQDTFWQSGAFFPTGHVSRVDANSALWGCNDTTRCTSSNTGGGDLYGSTDGSFMTGETISSDGQSSWMRVQLLNAAPLYGVGCRISTSSSPIRVFLESESGQHFFVGELNSTKNYQYVYWILGSDLSEIHVEALYVNSTATGFTLTELCAISSAPFEYITADMGSLHDVGWIDARIYTGSSSLNASLHFSTDNINWQFIALLYPHAIPSVPTRLPRVTTTRYIRIVHQLTTKDWAKASIWEIAAYDYYGPYGPPPEATKATRTIADILGVNGIWGWGTKAYSTPTNPAVGPSLYTSCSTHGRNYHSMSWDVLDPDDIPDYEGMAAGNGTEAQWWLNWDTEYIAWNQSGLEVEASIQFTNDMFPESVWDNPQLAGYNYGYAFAQHFGPSSTGIVKVLEVGNEPWDYSTPFYRLVLQGMASGAKAGDPLLFVIPGAFQASSEEDFNASSGNYVGTHVIEGVASYLDGLNVHAYSYISNFTGSRIGTYPENFGSSTQSVKSMIRFRNANMPGKPVFLTEWGWDSASTGVSCATTECVNEFAAAVYSIRGALMFIRFGVERLTWFFYADGDDCNTLYCRSGLSQQSQLAFTPKSTLKALSSLVSLLGNSTFTGTTKEDDEAWVYNVENEYSTFVVMWLPTDASVSANTPISFTLWGTPTKAWRLSGESFSFETCNTPTYAENSGTWQAGVYVAPTVVLYTPVNPPSGESISASSRLLVLNWFVVCCVWLCWLL